VPFGELPLDMAKARLLESGAVDFNATKFSVSTEGMLLISLPAPKKSSLVWVNRTGTISPIAGSSLDIPRPEFALSPDGRRAAFVVSSGPEGNIVVRDLETGADTRLTFNKADDTVATWAESGAPAWFPQGDRIVHMSGEPEALKLFARRSDIAGEPSMLTPGWMGTVSADGHTLIFVVDERGTGRLRRAPLLPDGTVGPAQPVFSGDEPNVRDFDLSKDGRLLAYGVRQADSKINLFLTEFPTGNGRWLLTDGGSRPRFSKDGREIFFLKGFTDERGQPTGALMSATVSVDSDIGIGTAKRLFAEDAINGPVIEGYDVAPDRKRFLMSKPVAPLPGETTRLVLVQNWIAALK
jgi:Tol biopolymer transport system component